MMENNINFNESHLPSKRYQVSIDGLNRKEAKALIKTIWFAELYGASKATITKVISSGRAWSLSETKAKEDGEE